jgi:hypothetical protein
MTRFRHPEGRRLRGSEGNACGIAYEARGISCKHTTCRQWGVSLRYGGFLRASTKRPSSSFVHEEDDEEVE